MEASPAPDAWGLLWTIVQILALALLTVPAWLLGGVLAETQFWLFVVAGCAMLACWGVCLGRAMSSRPLPTLLIPLLLALVLGALHQVPLPGPIHRWVSPGTQRWWRELDPPLAAEVGAVDAARYPLSLNPASTRRDLYLLTLAVAGFVLGATVLADRLGFLVAGVVVALNGAALAFFGLVQQLTWNGRLFWSIPLAGGGVPFASYVNRNNAAGFLNMCLGCGIGLTVWGLVHASFHARRHAHGERSWHRSAGLGGPPGEAWSAWQNGLRAVADGGKRLLLLIARLNAATMAGLIAAGCMAAGIVCSLSRGATLSMLGAAAITLLAVALAGRWRRGWLGALAVAALTAGWLVSFVGQGGSVRERLLTIFDPRARQAEARLANWADGWRAAQDLLPAGSGLGTYRYIYRLYQQRADDVWYYHAENQYLQALVEAGLPGLGLLLSALGLVALACWRLLCHAPDAASYALGVAGTFAVSSQSLHAVFDFGLYLPANMLLLAVLCGAVCGRAARSEGPARRPADGALRWPVLLVALPPLRPLAASCCMAFTGLLLLGSGEARQALAVDTALADAKPLDLQVPHSKAAVDRCLAQFSTDSAGGIQDVHAQLKLAELWSYRMRLELFQVLRQEAVAGLAESTLWSATELTHVHGWLQGLADPRGSGQAAELRRSPAVLENLPQAMRHLRLARGQCPLLPEIHLLLAQLSILATADADNRADLLRVRWTACGQPALLTRCGQLELQAGRTVAACACWRHSLALAPEQLPEILTAARPNLDLATHIGDLIPDSPALILDLVDAQFQAAADRPVRLALLSKAEVLVSSQNLDGAEASWFRGRIALLRNDARRAVAWFTQAVAIRPDETAWRYQLALALKLAGRYPEAQEQARVCLGIEPDNEQYEALLREVIRLQLTPKRRAGAAPSPTAENRVTL